MPKTNQQRAYQNKTESDGGGGAQVLEEGVRRKGEAVAAMRPVLDQTLADIQARLIFRAQAFIKVCFEQAPARV